MSSQTLKRKDVTSFNNDDISDDDYVTWGRKKSRYLYTYNLQSPDLFSINDSDQTESVHSLQSKTTIEIEDELNSVLESTSDSNSNKCDDSYSQDSSQLDNSDLEVAKCESLFGSNDGYSVDTDLQVKPNQETPEKPLQTRPFFKTCVQCTKENPNPHFQYCKPCFTFRKQWFDSKPDPKPKKIISRFKRSDPLKDSLEAFASQESGSFGMSGLYLSQESQTNPFNVTETLCNVCLLKPKNGLFCHNKTSHVYSCYTCSKKIWLKSGKCPICKLKISPTKPTSKLELLGNVKNQMSSWLGSGIPGLRKSDSEVVPDPPAELLQDADAKESFKEKEDDNSSATGDPDTPISDGDDDLGNPQGENVSTKALQGAKTFGSFLYSAVNKAGKTVSEAGAKIKKTVGENSILGELNKEQESFLKDKKGSEIAAVPPWVGHPNEEAVKAECLALSTDRRNFVRSPPVGVDFSFNYESSYPVAMAILAEDPNLEKMRFDLVPKIINEESFWQNYFYRVNLICNASNLETLESANYNTASSNVNSDLTDTSNSDTYNYVKEIEFVSDTFAEHDTDEINELKKSLKESLGVVSPENEEHWENELEAELQDYEIIKNNNDGHQADGTYAEPSELYDLK